MSLIQNRAGDFVCKGRGAIGEQRRSPPKDVDPALPSCLCFRAKDATAVLSANLVRAMERAKRGRGGRAKGGAVVGMFFKPICCCQ